MHCLTTQGHNCTDILSTQSSWDSHPRATVQSRAPPSNPAESKATEEKDTSREQEKMWMKQSYWLNGICLNKLWQSGFSYDQAIDMIPYFNSSENPVGLLIPVIYADRQTHTFSPRKKISMNPSIFMLLLHFLKPWKVFLLALYVFTNNISMSKTQNNVPPPLPSRDQVILPQVWLLHDNIWEPTANTQFQIPGRSHYTE